MIHALAKRGATPVVTILLALIAIAAIAAPWIAPYDPSAQLDIVQLKNASPSSAHFLGTDVYSRDVLSRLLFGARTSLVVGLAGAFVAVALASVWGIVAASCSERVGRALMGLVDACRAVPQKVVLLAAILLIPHPTPVNLAILLGATSWFAMSRVVFTQVQTLRSRDFLTAARALGVSPLQAMRAHIAPHLLGTITALGTVLVADLMAAEAGLSFLGLGVRAPESSWGSMLQDGVPYLASAWWVAAAPSALLVVTVLCIAVVADRLHEARVGTTR